MTPSMNLAVIIKGEWVVDLSRTQTREKQANYMHIQQHQP